ncbi:hypothetical protein JG688_00017588 [Phytophthora aleatoria]|uniref:Uncharacterized protein n=1 Tax=Phytophthora aleatoria TaxID=2496075 RepID=A0A8J5IX08_9STRA|nr:hypothetical protein JG688_00017588 [Phytophthora aleatoria]
MVVVEAYLACRCDMIHVATLDFRLPLIYNDRPVARTRHSGVSTMDVDGEYIDEFNSHHLKALIELPQYASAR